MQVEISCECKRSIMSVPCKDFRKDLYPECDFLCEKPSSCHHQVIQSHYCHRGPCPPCSKECGLQLECGHLCKAICHEGVCCPECHEMVEKECEGKHENVTVFCCEKDKPVQCSHPCGKLLSCKKHVGFILLKSHCHSHCHSQSLSISFNLFQSHS